MHFIYCVSSTMNMWGFCSINSQFSFFVGHSKSVGDVSFNKKPLKTKLQQKNL